MSLECWSGLKIKLESKPRSSMTPPTSHIASPLMLLNNGLKGVFKACDDVTV